MRKILHHIIPAVIALAAVIAAGCSSRDTGRQLAHAVSIVEEHPDSARKLLDRMDSRHLSKSQEALYGVLDAQTRHKLNMPLPASDSLLNLAVGRYTAHGPDSLLMKALFYRGVTREAHGAIEEATADATMAWEYASSIRDSYWKAKSAELIADLTNSTSNYQEEMKWRKMAAEEYKKAGEMSNHLSSLCDIASAYLNLHDAERALAIDDSIRPYVMDYADDLDLQKYYAYTSMFIHNSYGSIERADSLYEFLKRSGDNTGGDPSMLLVKANCLLKNGKYDECRTYLDSVSPLLSGNGERSMLYYLYLRLARATGRYDLVETATDTLLAMQMELISGALHQPVTSTQRDYFHVKMIAKDEARRRAVVVGWIIAIGFLCIVMAGIILYRIQIKRKERILNEKIHLIFNVSEQLKENIAKSRELEEELASTKNINSQLTSAIESIREYAEIDVARVNSLKTELRNRESRITRLSSQLAKKSRYLSGLYAEKWTTLNMLSREFINMNKDEDSTIIVANISNELEKLKSSQFYRSLENDLNRYEDGIISLLRWEMKKDFDENDIRLIMLMMAGLSANAIAILRGYAISSVYAARQRIIRRIEKKNPIHKDLFLSMIKS
ncbi:MAG: hypothetical protein K2F87_02845 [Muribaculaceae bacterium]|nr:hypothetical protein [Muribaculaceae bacterium]